MPAPLLPQPGGPRNPLTHRQCWARDLLFPGTVLPMPEGWRGKVWGPSGRALKPGGLSLPTPAPPKLLLGSALTHTREARNFQEIRTISGSRLMKQN